MSKALLCPSKYTTIDITFNVLKILISYITKYYSNLTKIEIFFQSKMKFCLFVFAFGCIGLVQCDPPNFDYDFSGFKQLTQLMPTTCDEIEVQVCSNQKMQSHLPLFKLNIFFFVLYRGTCIQVSQIIGLLQAPGRNCMYLGGQGVGKCV